MIFQSCPWKFGVTALVMLVCNVASFMPYCIYCLLLMIFSLVISTYGLHFLEYTGILGKQSEKKIRKNKNWFWKQSFCCQSVKGSRRHMKIFISLWRDMKFWFMRTYHYFRLHKTEEKFFMRLGGCDHLVPSHSISCLHFWCE